MVCTSCTADVPDDDLFCENCGAKLARVDLPAAAGCTCGAEEGEVDEDGFCLRCGRRVRRPASDHIEQALGTHLAAVSDRGLRHDRNEDRFALVEAGAGVGMAVCDGVSATKEAEVASAIAAEHVRDALAEALRGDSTETPQSILEKAAAQVVETLRQRAGEGGDEASPSTTLVAALVVGNSLTVGWIGDSRAYWFDADGAHLLTRDHSWLQMVLEAGTMPLEQAEASPQAHAITRWLGADAEEAGVPEIVQHTIAGAGTLLLCTDGLWNYMSDPEQLRTLLAGAGEMDALSAARRLVDFANERGGRDNITVALLRWPAPPGDDAGTHRL